jgi:streptogramin lyase
MKRLLLVILLTTVQALIASDVLVGSWVLNLKNSKYRPGPPPASQTRVYREGPGGITASVITVTHDGKTTTAEFPENYDGQLYPVTGSPDYDGIKMRRVSNYDSESELVHAGKVIAKTTRRVSGDGQTLTITFDSTTADGSPIHNVVVYDRK